MDYMLGILPTQCYNDTLDARARRLRPECLSVDTPTHARLLRLRRCSCVNSFLAHLLTGFSIFGAKDSAFSWEESLGVMQSSAYANVVLACGQPKQCLGSGLSSGLVQGASYPTKACDNTRNLLRRLL